MRKKIIFTLLTVVWMTVIFSLSNDPADESGEKSLAVGKLICRITVKGYHDLTVSKQEANKKRFIKNAGKNNF